MKALEDQVRHVLSEGDLTAASMALLLGLASGTAHKLGFLVLDDPAQGMDDALQARLAAELANLPEQRQVIILTHQTSFIDLLRENGATHSPLGRWEGGRLEVG